MSSGCLSDIDVVVLAGGLGTRISSVLKETPKLLAPIGDRPYLDFLLTWLISFGAKRIIFGLGHLAGSVSDYLNDNPPKGIEIVTIVESKPLGTGGAIANVRPALKSNPVLVMNGDSFVDADLCDFLAHHSNEKVSASILCTEVGDASRYGAVTLDEKNRVVAFQEKNDAAAPGLINAGIYVFDTNTIQEIADSGPSLESDFFQKIPAGRLAAMSGDFTFLDIGTPEDLALAPEVLGKYHNN
jgi:mannose-1-phosphate guanylyltransferase